MVCKKCKAQVPAKAGKCPGCGTPARSRLSKWKARFLSLAWAVPYLGIPAFQGAVVSAYLTRQEEGTKPPKPDNPDGPPIPDHVRDDSDDEQLLPPPDPMLQPVVHNEGSQKVLFTSYQTLARQERAESLASLNLDAIVGRIDAKSRPQVESDIANGGPFADFGFRERLRSLVGPDPASIPPGLLKFDATLPEDIRNLRPITRMRVLALADLALAKREQVEATIGRERAILAFIRSLPGRVPWTEFLLVSDPPELNAVRKRLGERKIIEVALNRGDVVYLKSGQGFDNDHTPDSVDRIDVLLLMLERWGVTRIAYEYEGMELREGLEQLRVAERDLRKLAEASESPAAKSSDPPSLNWPQLGKEPHILDTPAGVRETREKVEDMVRESIASEPVTEPREPSNPASQAPETPPSGCEPRPGDVAPPGPFRQWSNVRGQTCYARLVSVDGGWVMLEEPSGERNKYLATNLGEADKAYLKPFIEAQKKRADPSAPKDGRKARPKRRATGERAKDAALQMLLGRP